MCNFKMRLCLFVLFLFVLSSDKATAVPILFDDLVVVKAGMTWLSPVQSAGLSYKEMEANLNTTYTNKFYGYRFASLTEIRGLVASYGVVMDNPISSYLIEEIYNDFFPGETNIARGWIGDQFAFYMEGGEEFGWFEEMILSIDAAGNYVYNDIYSQSLTYNHRSNQGWWLVKGEAAPVPEPATVVLFGIGITCVVGRSRRCLSI